MTCDIILKITNNSCDKHFRNNICSVWHIKYGQHVYEAHESSHICWCGHVKRCFYFSFWTPSFHTE